MEPKNHPTCKLSSKASPYVGRYSLHTHPSFRVLILIPNRPRHPLEAVHATRNAAWTIRVEEVSLRAIFDYPHRPQMMDHCHLALIITQGDDI